MEIRRILLAFALSAAVLILWPKLFPAPNPASPPITAVTPSPAEQAATDVATAPTPQPAASPTPAPAPAVPVEPVLAGAEETVEVKKPLYTARVSNRGGTLVSFALSRYKGAKGEPLDLVRKGDGFRGVTLGLAAADAFLTRAAGALFVVERVEEGDETVVRFRYREADGNGVVRTYRFGSGYVVGLDAQREGPAAGPIGLVLGPSLGTPSPEDLKAAFTKPGGTVVLRPDGKADTRAADGLKEALPIGPGATAVGLEDNYFLTIFLPAADATATLRPAMVKPPAGEERKESEVVLSAAGALKTDVFLGPKQPEVLDTVRPVVVWAGLPVSRCSLSGGALREATAPGPSAAPVTGSRSAARRPGCRTRGSTASRRPSAARTTRASPAGRPPRPSSRRRRNRRASACRWRSPNRTTARS